MVASALRRSEHNKPEAALLLGLSKSTFHRKAEKHQKEREQSKANRAAETQVDTVLGSQLSS
jgi:DNA-binding NtrC family response regulator